MHLSQARIMFKGEKGDPLGLWRIEIDVFDVNGAASLKLSTQFVLEDDGSKTTAISPPLVSH
jgi:hypothetical protein